MKLGSDLDFDQGQALNMVLHNAATAAIGAALTLMAQMGYDTTAQRALVFDGTTIRKLLQDNDIDTSQTLGGAGASDLKVASQKAVKAYADNLLTQGQTAFVDFDASAQTQFPAGSTLSSRYRVTVAGTVQGVILQAMDVFYPRIASPSQTTSTDWIFVQGNADAATNTVFGMVLLATLAEIQANAGGNANKVITVATLNSWEAALGGRIKKFAITQNVAVGANSIVHGLGNSNIQVQAYDSTGPIFYQWTNTNTTTIAVTANKAKTNVTFIVQG